MQHLTFSPGTHVLVDMDAYSDLDLILGDEKVGGDTLPGIVLSSTVDDHCEVAEVKLFTCDPIDPVRVPAGMLREVGSYKPLWES